MLRPSPPSYDNLALPLAAIEATTVALVRVDERLLRAETVLAEGAVARAHVFEAQALVRLAGGSVPLEDVVLHDAGMDVRLPTAEVIRAVSILQHRRSIATRPPQDDGNEAALRLGLGLPEGESGATEPVREKAPAATSFRPWDMPRPGDGEGDEEDVDYEPDEPLEDDDPADSTSDLAAVDALLARSRRTLASFNDLASEPGRARLTTADPAHDGARRLQHWQEAVAGTEGQPTVWAAAVALDAWLLLEPSERRGELGFLLAAQVLRQRGLVTRHLPALALGLRRERLRWSPHQPRTTRLAGLLSALGESAAALHADLDRLALARQVMLRRCAGKRGNSRLHELVDCFTASPLVTVQMAARQLGVSPQGIEAMLGDLGSALPREITGRKRYRAWGVL